MPNEGPKYTDFDAVFPNTITNGKLVPMTGRPSYLSLVNLRKQLTANAATIQSSLGGGQHGHAGLVLPPTIYATMSDTPFELPPAPTLEPVYPPNATAAQISATDRIHTEHWRRYHESHAVHTFLKNQLLQCLESHYTRIFMDSNTGVVTMSILQMFDYLFQTYGQVTNSEVQAQIQAISTRILTLHEPLAVFYADVDDLIPLADAANVPLSSAQILAIALDCFKNSKIFKDYVREWTRKADNEKTWTSFKLHFSQAQEELIDLDMDTPVNAIYHTPYTSSPYDPQAFLQFMNMMAGQNQGLMSPHNVQQPPVPLQQDQPLSSSAPATQHQANHAPSDNRVDELQRLVSELLKRQKKDKPMTAPRSGQPKYRLSDNLQRYCFTHGRCNHTSDRCRNKCPTHNDEATMDNKLGGSTWGFHPPPPLLLKADTGATGHYVKPSHAPVLHSLKPAIDGPMVGTPTGHSIIPSHSGLLPIPSLSPQAQQAYVFPDLRSASLFSIGKACDDDCIAVLDKHKLYIFKYNALILQGYRNHYDGLWDIPLPNPQCNVLIDLNQKKRDLAAFFHAIVGAPPKSTFLTALRKEFFITWPGLTVELINNHLDEPVYTSKGHMRQEQQGLRSTRVMNHMSQPVSHEDFFPPQDERSHECYLMLFPSTPGGKSYSDLTGRFPVRSSRGNEYVLVVYDYDSNCILAEPIRDRQAATIRDATLKAFSILSKSGFQPRLHVLDNECSALLKTAFTKHNISYELVPPYQKRRNAAERAIQTFKNHFITILTMCDSKFPLNEWDRLIPQALITLNHLRASRSNPNISAYTAVFGNYNFNKTPLAPLGCKVVYHEKPDNRSSWAPRGTEAWYVGPAPNHYRCVTVFNPETSTELIVDTVKFFPEKVQIPSTSMEDNLLQSCLDILAILKQPTPLLPALDYTNVTTKAVADIAELLSTAVRRPSALPQPHPQPLLQPQPDNLPSSQATEPSKPHNLPSTLTTKPSTNAPSTNDPSATSFPCPSPTKPITAPLPRVQLNQPLLPSSPSGRLLPRVPPSLPPPQPVPPVSDPVLTSSPVPCPQTKQRPTHSRRTCEDQPIQFPTHPYYTRNKYSRAVALANLLLDRRLDNDVFLHPSINHIFNEQTGKRETMDSLLAGPNGHIWSRSLGNELGRLAQGIRDIQGTDTIHFINKSQVPAGRKVTYANAICDFRPKKDDPYRVRLTAGGDKLEYPYDASSPAAGLTETKTILNSTISTPGARFMTIDIKDFFLNNPMAYYEYMRIPVRWLPQEIIDKYNLNDLIVNGYVYVEIRKGMYGLKQAARIAYDRLVLYLKPHGYEPSRTNPGLWKHISGKVHFALCVDDFGVKYTCKRQVDHLLDTLRKQYPIQYDWSGADFCGLNIAWNYEQGFVDIFMRGYLSKVQTKYQHPTPTKIQHCPHPYREIRYGAKIQYADAPDETPRLSPEATKEIQGIVGSLLFYGRAVDYSILPALNDISYQQSKPTQHTRRLCNQLLDFVLSQPKAVIRFYKSDMILYVHSDAAYLVLPRARSRVAGYYFFGNKHPNAVSDRPNGAILVECKKLDPVATSAAEAETGGLYINAQNAVPIRNDCEFLGHPQPANGTPLVTDNASAHGILTKLMKPRRSKAWDMRYHWLEDRIEQNQFHLIWQKGIENLADYFTKHHHPAVHRTMRPKYLQYLNCLVETFTSPSNTSHAQSMPSEGVLQTPPRRTNLATFGHSLTCY